MKRFKVSVCRIEHNIYLTDVEAKDSNEARRKAFDLFEDDMELNFKYIDCVHAEEFVQEVREVR